MNDEIKDLEKLADQLLVFGNKNGGEEIQININNGTEFTVEVRNGKIERLFQASSRSLSLKVIVLSKVATASTNDFSPESLQQLMLNAIKRAMLTSEDEFAHLPLKEIAPEKPENLKLFDASMSELAPEKKIDFAKKLESIALEDKRINMSLGSSFSTYIGETIVGTTNSIMYSYKHTNCNAGVYLQTGSGDNLFEDGWYESAINFNDLYMPEVIAKKAVERAVRLIGARKIETQKVPVIMEPEMTARLLGFLAQSVNGNAIYMNQSSMVDKIGKMVASEHVSVIDDGLMPGKLGSRPFDSEGVPCQKTPVIVRGVLQNYLLNEYAARKLKMRSTGNASGPTNFYLYPGDFSPEKIIKSVEKGLYLTNTIGQGFAQTTGDLSTGAYGIWIEKGELSYPVCEITISGNLLKMLSDIVMVGNDLKYDRAITGPTIKIAEMQISGK
jgi:PmbA protein